MEREMVAAFILAAVVIGVSAQAWVSWLDHKRRTKTLDVIKSAMEAGREPPRELYAQLEAGPYASLGLSNRPWGEAAVFAAVAIGFWIAFGAQPEGDQREKLLFVAAFMSAMSIGCAALALFRPGQRRRDDEQ